jgi:hypothetical protein
MNENSSIFDTFLWISRYNLGTSIMSEFGIQLHLNMHSNLAFISGAQVDLLN